MVYKKVGDKVEQGDILAEIHANEKELGQKSVKELLDVYEIVDAKVEKQKNILGVIA